MPTSTEPQLRHARLLKIGVPVVTVLVMLLLLEGFLRFMPVASAARSAAVNQDNPVFHFTPNRTFVHSMGWDMHNVVRGRINNEGFFNDQDYARSGPKPLLAIVGDSYIEAKVVPYADTMQGRLAARFSGRLRVYSFAASGAPLSQYLIWARHAVNEFGAKAIVINVVGNDFDESLSAYRVGPGFWMYHNDGGTLKLRLTDNKPGWLIDLLRGSALARYMIVNLHIHDTIFRMRWLAEWIFGRANATEFFGNTEAAAGAVRVRDSLAAIDAFFRDLPELVALPRENILFTVDGFRYPPIIEAARGSYFDIMRKAFLAKAKDLGYEAIDLDPIFAARNASTGERFEFPDDGHWSGNGHAIAAEEAATSGVIARIASDAALQR